MKRGEGLKANVEGRTLEENQLLYADDTGLVTDLTKLNILVKVFRKVSERRKLKIM